MLRSDLKALAYRTIRAPDRIVRQCVPVAIWRRLFPKSALCLTYHMVSDSLVSYLKHYSYLGVSEFETDVCYLKKQFGFITYDEILQRRLLGKPVHDNAAILTFDDGFAQCATVVQPVLLRHEATCIFFVITDLIDNRVIFRETQASLCIDAIHRQPVEVIENIVHELGLDALLQPPLSGAQSRTGCPAERKIDPESLVHWLLNIAPAQVNLMDGLCDRLGVDVHAFLAKNQPYLSTQQIRQLHSNGFTIGGHSCSHQRLQDLSLIQAEYEIVESCRIIRDLTGQKSVPFAFPWSGAGLDRTWLAQIRRKHDFIGLFFDTGSLRRDAPFVVQRVDADRAQETKSMSSILHCAWSQPVAWRLDV